MEKLRFRGRESICEKIKTFGRADGISLKCQKIKNLWTLFNYSKLKTRYS